MEGPFKFTLCLRDSVPAVTAVDSLHSAGQPYIIVGWLAENQKYLTMRRIHRLEELMSFQKQALKEEGLVPVPEAGLSEQSCAVPASAAGMFSGEG